jgi:hypothetical protein
MSVELMRAALATALVSTHPSCKIEYTLYMYDVSYGGRCLGTPARDRPCGKRPSAALHHVSTSYGVNSCSSMMSGLDIDFHMKMDPHTKCMGREVDIDLYTPPLPSGPACT